MARGVNHIDTSDFYGPHVTNQLIREALHPYRDDLVIVTKVGAVRGDDGSWIPALTPADLTRAVHDNLRNLGLDALDVVNLRVGGALTARRGIDRATVHHAGRASAARSDPPPRAEQRDPGQVEQARGIAEVVCVQNHYNLVHRDDDELIDELGEQLASPMCRSSRSAASRRSQSSTLSDVATQLGATPMQVALAWLLRRAPNILLIPGTSSVAHLRENLAAAGARVASRGTFPAA